MMKVLDSIRVILILVMISAFFYFLTDALVEEHEKRKRYFKIEFSNGRSYWADSVNVISGKEIHFFDVHSKRNVTIYGHFVLNTPKNK
jgi:hypothetical protein